MRRSSCGNNAVGSLRIGLIAVISLVIMLCLSVLAVLTLTTASASHVAATRQQQFTDASYANDFTANKYLAQIDAALQNASLAGETADAAMERVRAACPNGALVEERDVTIVLTTKVGRMLTVKLHVNNDLTYSVVEWSASTNQEVAGSEGDSQTGN